MLRLQSQPDINNEKVVRNPAETFAELYEKYLPKVFRYVHYRVVDTPMAEDLTSQIFEKALTKFKSFSSEKATFSTWIFAIARNTVIDHYRITRKEQTVPLHDTPWISNKNTSPEQEVVVAEELQKLESLIAQLSQQEQEIISLKFGAEMTNRQIARMLDLSESNVGTIIYRAVRKLRDNFKGWQNE